MNSVHFNEMGRVICILRSCGTCRVFFILLAVAFLFTAFGSGTNAATIPDAVTELWTKTYDGPTHDVDWAYHIAVDHSGNIVVTGVSLNASGDYDILTIKYDPNGNALWTARYNGPGAALDSPVGVRIDSQNQIYIAGSVSWIAESWDYGVIKYDEDGYLQWEAYYDGPGEFYDYARDMALDASGSVYVTGASAWYYNGDPDAPRADYGYATVKFRSDGSTHWVARWDSSRIESDGAWAIDIDDSGGVYVTGYTYGSAVTDFLTVAYDQQGTQRWEVRYAAPGMMNNANDLAVDAAGNVFVVGDSNDISTNYSDAVIVKYSNGGTQMWVDKFDGASHKDDSYTAMAVDSDGNIYVTGETESGSWNLDCLTVKFDSDGNRLWTAIYDDPLAEYDTCTAIVIDDAGKTCVTGATTVSGTDVDFLTIVYDADGNEVWHAVHTGSVLYSDSADEAAIGPDGSVYVTGSSYDGFFVIDNYHTVKYGVFSSTTTTSSTTTSTTPSDDTADDDAADDVTDDAADDETDDATASDDDSLSDSEKDEGDGWPKGDVSGGCCG